MVEKENLKQNNIEFLFNKNKLYQNYISYKEKGDIFYPVKANANGLVLKNLKCYFDDADGFLISNISQFNDLIKLNISPRKMCLMNVLASSDTIKYLYKNGVRFFCFDDLDSLKEFLSYANLNECKISVRINTVEVFDDAFIHLGASYSECREMLTLLNNNCKKVGISFYIQKKLKKISNVIEKMLDYIKENFNEYNLNFISIAGINKEIELDKEYLKNLKEEMKLDEIILEPGKYLVGDVIDLKTRVIRTKNIKDKRIIIIKNGIYNGLLDVLVYDEKFKFYFKDTNNKYHEFSYIKDSEHDFEVYMCGGSSDSIDVIGTMYISSKYEEELNNITEILIKDVGAYFEEFFMSYGGDINKIYTEVN